jgi:hypothetical protein
MNIILLIKYVTSQKVTALSNKIAQNTLISAATPTANHIKITIKTKNYHDFLEYEQV